MAGNIIHGGVKELEKIRKDLEAQADIKKQLDSELVKKNGLDKEYESAQKALQNNIDTTVKRRREQVVATFDKELATAQDKMKDARNSKDKEKTKKVNKRIDAETSSLVLANKNIMEEKKTFLKQKDISSIWDKPLTYVLYFPKSFIEKLEFLLLAIICLVGIPLLVFTLVEAHIAIKVIIFIVIDVMFIFMYMFGFEKTRMQNYDAFMEVYNKRKEIKKNNKQIKKIKRKILKDKDESRYDLGKFDDNINEIEDRINDIVKKKNDALNEFEKNTKAEITKEIKSKEKPKLDKLKADLEKASADVKALEEKQKDISLNITTNYAPYIGAENLNVRKIDAMIAAINDGKAKDISEAVSAIDDK